MLIVYYIHCLHSGDNGNPNGNVRNFVAKDGTVWSRTPLTEH